MRRTGYRLSITVITVADQFDCTSEVNTASKFCTRRGGLIGRRLSNMENLQLTYIASSIIARYIRVVYSWREIISIDASYFRLVHACDGTQLFQNARKFRAHNRHKLRVRVESCEGRRVCLRGFVTSALNRRRSKWIVFAGSGGQPTRNFNCDTRRDI